MSDIKLIESAIKKIINRVLTENVEFGEFKNDPIAWRAANLIYDNHYSGVTLGRLYGYLRDESKGNFDERKFFNIVQQLKDSGEFIVKTNSEWHKGKIYYKAFKTS
jgi:hypothetical protein